MSDCDFDNLGKTFDRAFANFDSVARQRLIALNFYFILTAASVAAYLKIVTDIEDTRDWTRLALFYAVANICLPLAFAFLDFRFKQILESLKQSLRWVESHSVWPDGYKTFTSDKQQGLRRYLSLANGLRFIFSCHFVSGLCFLCHPISPERTQIQRSGLSQLQQQEQIQEQQNSWHKEDCIGIIPCPVCNDVISAPNK